MAAKRKSEAKAKVGRPTKYTVELGEEICATIASSELGLLHLCNANPHWPDRAQIFIWRRKHAEFRDNYARAKEEQTEVTVEYMQELMNEPHKYTDRETGQERIDVPMLRLKMDTMKWQAGKLKPKKFGDIRPEEVQNDTLHADVIKRKHELDDKNRKEF